MALRDAVAKFHGGRIVPELPPRGHHQSNGVVAEAGKTTREYCRVHFDNVVWAGVATLCNLPSTAVPVGLHSNGLPFGLQIVGPEYADRTTMAVARWLEEAGYVTRLAEGYQ